MFSNEYRLRNAKRITEVFKFGKSLHGKYVFIKYISNKQDVPRVAVSVSTKIFKQAIKRNRIKRLIREVLKLRLSHLPKLDILVIAKSAITADIALDKLQKDISKIIKKI